MVSKSLNLDAIHQAYEQNVPYQRIGKIFSNRGGLYEVNFCKAVIGGNVEIVTECGDRCLGEVVGIQGNRCMVMPYEEISGVNSETKVYLKDLSTMIPLGFDLMGRVVDFRCHPMDGKGPLENIDEVRSVFGSSINPLERPPVDKIFNTGIHAIDFFTTVGKGQRLAILAGSGVGKSVSIGMIAKNSSADVNVIALVGERGREVLEFIQKDLGPGGLDKSVVVVATSDQSPLIKIKAAYVATTIAEYFRDQKLDVILMFDSITRFAMAHREISLGLGESPGPRGYTPSVFAKLSKLMERAGTKKEAGSITGFYTVLVEGGDIDEPLSDAVRAVSDGHIILSRELSLKNQFPAIDVLQSLSRVMNGIIGKEHRVIANYLRDLLSVYRENEDLINIGAYSKGTNVKLDKAVAVYDDVVEILKQEHDSNDYFNPRELYEKMVEIARKAENADQDDDGEKV